MSIDSDGRPLGCEQPEAGVRVTFGGGDGGRTLTHEIRCKQAAALAVVGNLTMSPGYTVTWEGEAGCSLATAYTGPATTVLWPCRRARFLRLDLQEPNDCCYQILEWETLGLGSDASESRLGVDSRGLGSARSRLRFFFTARIPDQ